MAGSDGNSRIERLLARAERSIRAGDAGAAAATLEEVLRREAGHLPALRRLAALKSRAGDPRGAADLLQRATAIRPDDPELQHALGLALEDSGAFADAAAAFTRAVELYPQYAEALNSLGNVLQPLHRYEDALAAYRAAEAIAPDAAEIQSNLGNLIEARGEVGAAVERYRRAVRLKPDFAAAHFHLARGLLALGEPAAALESVAASLRHDPNQQQGLALLALLLNEVGRTEEYRALYDFDRFVRRYRPAAPAGFADIDDFNRALAGYVRDHASLIDDPYDASTHNGRHSGNLLQDGSELTAALKGMLQGIFSDYIGQLPVDPGHPFLAMDFPECRVVAQAQLLNPEGFLEFHIHPASWVSGAYYVQLPDAVDDATRQGGWIEFGRPPANIRTTAELDIRRFRPEEGTIILFPSYFFHGTLPFESGDLRISLGVDLVPTR